MNPFPVLAVLLLAVLAPAQAATPDPIERQLLSTVDANAAAAEALLQQLVDIESPTEDHAGVKRVGAVLDEQFTALGMHTEWVDMPAQMQRAGHLRATTSGTRGKRVLLLGHIDTVLRGERFRREGHKAWGTGINDMKAGVVTIVSALQALHAAGALADSRIEVILTGDEEDAGMPISASRALMTEAAKRSDLVLSFEVSIDGTATVGRRGSSSWILEVSAKTGHSSGIFTADAGNGAIFEVARILDGFYATLHGEKYLTFNPSLIAGGSNARLDGFTATASGKSNVIPAAASVLGDLRFISEEQKENARRRMREIVAAGLPGTSASIRFEDANPAMTPTEANHALLRVLDAASRDNGLGPVEALDPGRRGAGDIGFIAHLLPGLDGLGGGHGDNAHAPGEWADLRTLPVAAKRTALLLRRLTR